MIRQMRKIKENILGILPRRKESSIAKKNFFTWRKNRNADKVSFNATYVYCDM